jgi:hypothetical protein
MLEPGRLVSSRLVSFPYYSRAREGSEKGERGRILLILLSKALRERGRAYYVSAAEFGRVDPIDPVAACPRPVSAPSPPPDQAKPTSASAPIARAPSSTQNLPTTISPKRNVDVGQQPQRRAAGRCRSVSSELTGSAPLRAHVRGARRVNGENPLRRRGGSGGQRR